MNGLELFDKLFNKNVMLGDKITLNEDLSIIPVYKLKVNTLNLNTDIKNYVGDGVSGGFSITPVCILKVLDNDISVITFEDKSKKDEIFDFIPSLLTNININDILKNIKI